MKAVLYDAPRSYAVTDVVTPEAGPGEVRIRVGQVGVCGTDLHIHEGDFNAVFPGVQQERKRSNPAHLAR